MTTNTLPQRLRDLRSTARPHFQPHNPDGTARPAAFAIVATAERLDDLVAAADLLEVAPPVLQCPDLTAEEVAGIAEQLRGGPAMVTAEPAGDLVEWTPPGEALTHDQVREAARAQLNYRSLDGTVAIHDLCGMLGVKL